MPDAEPDCEGPVEVSESYFRDKERNKHANKCLRAGSGIADKTTVVGLVDHTTGQVIAQVVQRRTRTP